jgi:Protein of unknown function (DUF1559)
VEEEGEIPWTTLKIMGAIGGSVLLVLVLVTTIVNNWHRAPKVEHIAKFVKEAPKFLAPPAAPEEERPGPAETDNSATAAQPIVKGPQVAVLPKTPSLADEPDPFDSVTAPQALVTNKPEPPAASAVARLPRGVEDWYAQPGARLSGIRRVNPTDPPIAHFSWMTGLLPFLGHGSLYQQFDFKQPLTKGKNLQLAGMLVPEFLNPLDDQQRWKGYPFDRAALTHFVGVSGVEDARNVVAAKLPRSDPRAGVFGYDEIARPEEITDGQSQTVMVAGAGALANPWVFGGGATIRGAREPLFDSASGLGTKGLSGGGSIVVMADGSVRHVTASVDPRVFKAMCTIRGADSVDLGQASTSFELETLKASRPANN